MDYTTLNIVDRYHMMQLQNVTRQVRKTNTKKHCSAHSAKVGFYLHLFLSVCQFIFCHVGFLINRGVDIFKVPSDQWDQMLLQVLEKSRCWHWRKSELMMFCFRLKIPKRSSWIFCAVTTINYLMLIQVKLKFLVNFVIKANEGFFFILECIQISLFSLHNVQYV